MKPKPLKIYKLTLYIILSFFMTVRHIGFEIIYRYQSIKKLKSFIKKIIPKKIFEYFHKKKNR